MNLKLSNKNFLLIGTNIVVILFISIAIGYWLDKKLNTAPKFLLIMLLLSLAYVFVLFWKIIKNINKINN